jgi:hypothetical protein
VAPGGVEVIVAPGGSAKRDESGDVEYRSISKLVESEATFTYPRMPWAVEQIVLVPGTPVERRSTQFMVKPLTVMVEEETLSPAKPAASENSLRKFTQCAGV